MISTEELDITISQYYDEEMVNSELFNFEARIAISKGIREYTDEKCFEFFKISNSMRLVKIRAQDAAKRLTDDILARELKEKSVLKLNSVIFERLNKVFSRFFLNIRRNDS